MEDFDDLEEHYFAKAKDQNPMKEAKLKGLYEYTMLLKVPSVKGLHVPYRLLTQLAAVAPKGAEAVDYVAKRLVAYGMLKASTPELVKRISWAAKWAGREARPTSVHIELSPSTKAAITHFAAAIEKLGDAESIQNAAFQSIKQGGLRPSDFFPAVYTILLGSDRGPRLGPYVVDSGPATVSRALIEAVASS